MQPSDFIATARDLAQSSARGRPRETNLRRAVSTTYYAMFHCLAQNCADLLVGGPGSHRSEPAWRQTYRALQHGTARQRCQQQPIRQFPEPIQEFARKFVEMQIKRENADYGPEGIYRKSDILEDIGIAENLIIQFQQADPKDRRAFAVYLLLLLRGPWTAD